MKPIPHVCKSEDNMKKSVFLLPRGPRIELRSWLDCSYLNNSLFILFGVENRQRSSTEYGRVPSKDETGEESERPLQRKAVPQAKNEERDDVPIHLEEFYPLWAAVLTCLLLRVLTITILFFIPVFYYLRCLREVESCDWLVPLSITEWYSCHANHYHLSHKSHIHTHKHTQGGWGHKKLALWSW